MRQSFSHSDICTTPLIIPKRQSLERFKQSIEDLQVPGNSKLKQHSDLAISHAGYLGRPTQKHRHMLHLQFPRLWSSRGLPTLHMRDWWIHREQGRHTHSLDSRYWCLQYHSSINCERLAQRNTDDVVILSPSARGDL